MTAAVDQDLLSAILDNALDSEDEEELAYYEHVLQDPAKLQALAQSVGVTRLSQAGAQAEHAERLARKLRKKVRRLAAKKYPGGG